jgi:hypothetical protein
MPTLPSLNELLQPRFFDKFPVELRLPVWKYSIGPRPISNLAKPKGNKVPTVLHLCRESRATTISSYTRFSITEEQLPIWSVNCVAYDILFNYDIDELFLHIQGGIPDMDELYNRHVEVLRFRAHELAGLKRLQCDPIQRITFTEDILRRSTGTENEGDIIYRAANLVLSSTKTRTEITVALGASSSGTIPPKQITNRTRVVKK